MKVFIYSFVVFFCFRVSAIELLKRNGDFSFVGNDTESGQFGGIVGDDGVGNKINSSVHMSVNYYYCAVEEIEDSVTILYGTKSWTFPAQDVNLTLSYPTANSDSELSSKDESSIITGFKVILHIDGIETKGYIMDGGVLQDSISLSFVSKNITSLSYQFWLFGMPQHPSDLFHDLSKRYYLCN